VLVQPNVAAQQQSPTAAADQAPAQPAAAGPARSDLFGDPLPAGALSRMGTLRWRHGAAVTFIGFVEDGKNLLTCSQDGFFRVWEVGSGKEVRRFGKGGAAVDPNTGQLMVQPGGAGVMVATLNRVLSVALSPDGKVLAAAGQDGIVGLWDVASGKEVRSIGNPKGARFYGAAGMVFSPDGKILALKGNDQTIRLFDIATASEIRQLAKPDAKKRVYFVGGQHSMAFAPDGKTIASVAIELENNQRAVGVVQFFDVATGNEVRTIKAQQNNFGTAGVAFSPDGKSLVWASADGTIRFHDASSGKEIRSIGQNQPGTYYSSLLFSPDGKLLATRSSRSPAIQLWDVDTGKEVRALGEGAGGLGGNNAVFVQVGGASGPQTVAFSPDGKILAEATRGNSIRLWDVAQGKEIPPSSGHQGGISGMTVTPDGKTLVTLGQDQSVRRWEVSTGRELGQFQLPGGVANATLSEDGRLVAFGSTGNTIQLWDVAQGKELRTVTVPAPQNFGNLVGGQSGIALSPDGKILAARGYDQTIYLYDTATGRQLNALSEAMPNQVNANGQVVIVGTSFYQGRSPGLVFSPDGRTLAAIGAAQLPGGAAAGVIRPTYAGNNAVRLWNVQAGKPMVRVESQQRGITALAWSADGWALVTAHTDNTLSVWEVLTGKEYYQIKLQPPAAGPAPNPAADVLQPAIARLPVNQQGSISTLAISPDGRTLAAGGLDRIVRLFDLQAGKELGQFKGHDGAILSLTFAGDSKTLVSGSADTTALVWRGEQFIKHEPPQAVELPAAKLDSLWKDLAGEGQKVYQAILTLNASPKQAVAMFSDRIRPAEGVDPKRIDQLITDLDSPKFEVREEATQELAKLGELAQPALQKVIDNQPGLEMRQRVEKLLERLVTGQAPPPEVLRALRAVQVMKRLATPEARELLQRLARGAPGDKLTRQAEAALRQLDN
jgi:WD40 repeat protein